MMREMKREEFTERPSKFNQKYPSEVTTLRVFMDLYVRRVVREIK